MSLQTRKTVEPKLDDDQLIELIRELSYVDQRVRDGMIPEIDGNSVLNLCQKRIITEAKRRDIYNPQDLYDQFKSQLDQKATDPYKFMYWKPC